MKAYIQERYGNSEQLRFVRGHALIPIGYVKHKNPMNKKCSINSYTPEGRAEIHKSLSFPNLRTLTILMRNPIPYRSTEYNDNRLSLFAAQYGKCAITGKDLQLGNIHCHHKVPKYLGGRDNYQNLILVTVAVHRLIHATHLATIHNYMEELKLTSWQKKKLNDLRKLAATEIVGMSCQSVTDGTPCDGKPSCTV